MLPIKLQSKVAVITPMLLLFTGCLTVFAAEPTESIPVRMVEQPSLSPDGAQVVFSWRGEIWKADTTGGPVTRLTNHPASDSEPKFSPDGSQIAFTSTRTGSTQVFVMQADGSLPRQVTFHTAGYSLADWFPNGRALLVVGRRDHFWRDAKRMIKIDLETRRSEQVLADATAENPQLSPDGKKVLFTREGERWWRKGYEGERAAQIWQLDLQSGEFTELLHEGVPCLWPLWMANGKGFYFTKGDLQGFDLWSYQFAKKPGKKAKQTEIVSFEEDSIVFPTLSSNGKTIVFRHLFDLYRFRPGKDSVPQKIALTAAADLDLPTNTIRRELDDAEAVAFTNDGLEIAVIAGGDIWVMDTVLREPIQVTQTAGYEESLLFSKDGSTLYFTTTTDGQTDIWKATKKSETDFWWQNAEFNLEQLTQDRHVESQLKLTPDGEHLAFQQGRGDLAVMPVDGGEKRVVVQGFSGLDFDISHDGRWLTYAQQDNNFNSEIWITSLVDEMQPVNVSRHPDNDRNPRFSPDGKILAFTGRRVAEEVDIYYVYLQNEEAEKTDRQRKIEEALELMQKKRQSHKNGEEDPDDAPQDDNGPDEEDPSAEDQEKDGNRDPSDNESIRIDFEDIHQRVQRISIRDSYESGLLWSPDGKKLAFNASIDGQRGWYTVEFPDQLSPKLYTQETGRDAVWSNAAGGVLYLNGGQPSKLSEGGKLERYRFSANQKVTRSEWLKAGFEKAWLTMREVWYDDRFANRNWDAIRRKYVDAAASAFDTRGLAEVVQLMLGELNGSHLGFYPSNITRYRTPQDWEIETAHLGVRFAPDHLGPGLLVRDVIPDGPADRENSRLKRGDIILSIDDSPVDPAMDLTEVLNGPLDRDIELRVLRKSASSPPDAPNEDAERVEEPESKAEPAEAETDKPETDKTDKTDKTEEADKTEADKTEADKPETDKAEAEEAEEADVTQPSGEEEFSITVRPISYSRARSLLYTHWLDHNRQMVDELSDGKLGYLHIRAMNMSSFYEFERQLYNVGYGRDGLVIDVRDNGGGSTTDILLTALTQPRHAITVPRGGGQGYPQGRAVFASWSKPIIVLCNQNSYSNAEIFSHSIKTLGRGKVVGVRTAGGVVSTGSASVNDVGRIRVPFRGWFVIGSGEDMERNGCEPDVTIWPQPGELPQGIDRQLEKAVRLLSQEVGDGEPPKQLIYASEKDLQDQ